MMHLSRTLSEIVIADLFSWDFIFACCSSKAPPHQSGAEPLKAILFGTSNT